VDVIGVIYARLRSLRARVDGMVCRAVIARVNDALETQGVQVTIRDAAECPTVEHMQPFGLSFTPPAGAQVIALAVGGFRSNTVAICADHPGKRPTGVPAECGGLYQNGQFVVYIDEAAVAHIGAQAAAAFIARADLTDARIEALRLVLNAHVHSGVTTGSGSSGALVTPLPAQASVAATKGKVT
jgi:phage baseplate assembly protein V